MAKMKKEYNPDHVRRRKRRPIIYIVCEGKETEINYFRHFRTRNCLVDIVPVQSKFTAAEYLVKHARSLLSQADYFPQDGDELWCVFDCDENSDAALRKAEEYANHKGYRIAFSNPCFEYWFLLHFVSHNGYLNGADEVLRLLRGRGRLEKYEKNKDVYNDLLPYQSEAVDRAKKRIRQIVNDNTPILSRNSNPVTTVYELVEYLNTKTL